MKMVKTKLKPGVREVCLQLANELQNILVNQKRKKKRRRWSGPGYCEEINGVLVKLY